MSAQHSVCRLCCNTVAEEDAEVINESVIEMLQTLLVRVDLTISENPIVCTTCRKKLEDHYSFKKKCVFIEDSITPFVAENVKINLKEIRSQIIKTEDMEDDENNVCRLCLQFVDNDMMLSDDEKEQFQQFFPEINLSRTSFVVLCSTCYDTLHKYFLFVTSCVELEQQLCNYSLDQTENKIDIADEKCSIKLENFQDFIKNVKEEEAEDEKEALLLNEELDIKCDTEEDDERCINNKKAEQLATIKEELNAGLFSNKNLPNRTEALYSDLSEFAMYKCDRCDKQFKHKRTLKKHVMDIHDDPSKVKWFECEQCDKKFKGKFILKRHVLDVHTDLSKITWFQCQECDRQFKHDHHLKVHVKSVHMDASKINMYKCEQCDGKFKQNHHLKRHVLTIHTSEIIMHKCGQCRKEFKEKSKLNRHRLVVHTDPSKLTMYGCYQCGKEFKAKYNLKKHFRVHLDPSKIKK